MYHPLTKGIVISVAQPIVLSHYIKISRMFLYNMKNSTVNIFEKISKKLPPTN